jgi:hypothetical protein
MNQLPTQVVLMKERVQLIPQILFLIRGTLCPLNLGDKDLGELFL